MPSPLNFIVLLAVISLIFVPLPSSAVCLVEGNYLNCSVSSGDVLINVLNYTTNAVAEMRIFYDGSVTLGVIASKSSAITIQPIDSSSSSNRLQIRRLETTANRIDIKIVLSLAQLATPLFSASSSFNTSSATVIVTIKQIIQNIDTFQIFGTPSTTNKTINDFQVIFDSNSTFNSGSLTLKRFLDGLSQASAITISGNGLTLDTSGITTPYQRVKYLTLKNLYLNDRILDSFENVSTLTIKECTYRNGAQFLQASRGFEISLTMENNNPLNGMLPNGSTTFVSSSIQYNSITLIEPKLNSSILTALGRAQRPRTVTISLGNYQLSDFEAYQVWAPSLSYLTVQNLPNLNVLPSKFFSKFDGIRTIVLEGTYVLSKSNLCPFVGTMIQADRVDPTVTLNITQANKDSSNACARTYIMAINEKSQSTVQCPGRNTNEDCDKWAKETEDCALVSFENNQCPGTVPIRINPTRFYFNGSYVQRFLNAKGWSSSGGSSTGSKDDEKLDYRPIIGALVGLLAAITILTITIFCIRRYRRREANAYVPSAPIAEKAIPPSSYDMSHVSIATSKTSKSSARALEKSFFPLQPTDEIAPPLYTPPSEAVASISAYKVNSAPGGRRDSVSTHATHVYETLDS